MGIFSPSPKVISVRQLFFLKLNSYESILVSLNQTYAKYYQIELQTFDNFVFNINSSFEEIQSSYLLKLMESSILY